MPDNYNKPTNRRLFLQSAACLGAAAAMPLARVADAKAVGNMRIAVVDTRFDDALRVASRLYADTHISMGLRPDAYRTWRDSLRSNDYDRVCGVTTWSDYQLLRNCLERAGYRLSQEQLIAGPTTLVSWSLRR